MNSTSLSIETCQTSGGPLYRITADDGTILMMSYDKLAAKICLEALKKNYPK